MGSSDEASLRARQVKSHLNFKADNYDNASSIPSKSNPFLFGQLQIQHAGICHSIPLGREFREVTTLGTTDV